MNKNLTVSVFHDQAAFYEAAGKVCETKDLKEESLAAILVEEEMEEFVQAVNTDADLADIVKECIDLIYVSCQYLNVMIGPDKALKVWKAVHKSNMDKCIDGKLVFRQDGKVMKPMGWRGPDLRKIVGG